MLYYGKCPIATPTNKLMKKPNSSISARKLRKLAERDVKVYRKSEVVPMEISQRDVVRLALTKTRSCPRLTDSEG